MPKQTFFAKSLEDDFATKTLLGKKKLICQKIEEIIKTKTIKPNTKSFGRKKRLSCTILQNKYLKTYRSQGIIFTTRKKPDYIFPFDLAVLSATNDIVVQYYRIKNNLHIHYNRNLIQGFEEFIFKDFSKMLTAINSPMKAWNLVNAFRKKNGFAALPKTKFRLVEYNEAIFHSPTKITLIAIFGNSKAAKKKAQKLSLPHYKTVKEFWDRKK